MPRHVALGTRALYSIIYTVGGIPAKHLLLLTWAGLNIFMDPDPGSIPFILTSPVPVSGSENTLTNKNFKKLVSFKSIVWCWILLAAQNILFKFSCKKSCYHIKTGMDRIDVKVFFMNPDPQRMARNPEPCYCIKVVTSWWALWYAPPPHNTHPPTHPTGGLTSLTQHQAPAGAHWGQQQLYFGPRQITQAVVILYQWNCLVFLESSQFYV